MGCKKVRNLYAAHRLLFSGFLLIVRRLHELSILDVVDALLHTLHDVGSGSMLQLEHPTLGSCHVEVVEDSVETYHSALTDFNIVLDVKQSETAGILLEVSHRTHLTTHCPIHVHLEEEVVGVGMLNHVVLHHLTFNLLELMAVAVVTELHAGSSHLLAHLIVEVADGLQVCQCLGNTAPGNYHILHTSTLVCINALIPPLESLCEILALQLIIIQVAGYMA